MTYTYAVLDVSPACYKEVRDALAQASYEHAFHQHTEDRGTREVIDMHGIALRVKDAPASAEYAAGAAIPSNLSKE